MKHKMIVMLMASAVMVSMLVACGTEERVASPSSESGSSEIAASPSPEAEESASSEAEVSADQQTLITNGGIEIALSDLEHYTESGDVPVVYYISDITPEAMMTVYKALG